MLALSAEFAVESADGPGVEDVELTTAIVASGDDRDGHSRVIFLPGFVCETVTTSCLASAKERGTPNGSERFALDPARGSTPCAALRSPALLMNERPGFSLGSNPRGPSARRSLNAREVPGVGVQLMGERVDETNPLYQRAIRSPCDEWLCTPMTPCECHRYSPRCSPCIRSHTSRPSRHPSCKGRCDRRHCCCRPLHRPA